MENEVQYANLIKISRRLKIWGVLLTVVGSIGVFVCFALTIYFMVYEAYNVRVKSALPFILFVVLLLTSSCVFSGGIHAIKTSKHIFDNIKGCENEE